MKREDLTPRQREVVEAAEPIVLVEGGPGTGKTTTALWAAQDALSREGVPSHHRVLFLTFSRTAVGQIAKRAPEVFSTARDRIEISTFHAFAYRLLRGFGRYAGFGQDLPPLESEARLKLLGRGEGLVYDDLTPGVLKVLDSAVVRTLIAERWPLIICDEFQDTSTEQWKILQVLSHQARLLLLADPNQMIYTFVAGVGPERLADARTLAQPHILLESRSHRDPSGAIPALGAAVRARDFEHEAVAHALASGRLRVFKDVDDESMLALIVDEVGRLRRDGARSVGIFGHSNEGVALLGAGLAEVGLDHVLIGIPEAHSEALAALAVLCKFGIGTASSSDARTALAVFLTACTRGSAPDLAVRMAHGNPLPEVLEQRLVAIEQALRDAALESVKQVVTVAAGAWEALGITRGRRPWRRAALDFASLARPSMALPVSHATIEGLSERVERRRATALVDFDATHMGPTQLMNFHQTKGREADAVVLVYRSDDYWGKETEPFENASRVLFVSITRARKEVVVLLPSEPHPLVAPFVYLNETAATS